MHRPRPSTSFANVVSLIALFVALGGTGYAVTRIDSGDVKNNSLTSKDVKNRSLTGKDVKNNALGGAQVKEGSLAKVPSATTADTAGSAATAANAANAANANTVDGLNAADLQPRAYGFVEADGDLVASRSQGITADQVNVGGGGFAYCFELGYTPRAVVATAEANPFDVGGERDILRDTGEDPSCGDGTHELLLVTTDGAGAPASSAFNFIIY